MISETDIRYRSIVVEARSTMGTCAYWRDRESGVVHITVGVTLRQHDLVPLVRHYPHGRTGFEFAAPLQDFLDHFERTEVPL